MKITKVNIPKSVGDGLGDIEMDRLGHIVLLAGKNGSGKTRILAKIFATLDEKPSKNFIDNAQAQKKRLEHSLESNKMSITAFQKKKNQRPMMKKLSSFQ